MTGADAGSGEPARPTSAPAPGRADVGIVAALSIEVGYLIDRLRDVRRIEYAAPHPAVIEGECAGKRVALIVAGPGVELARRGARTLIEGHRPDWILSPGFAGALDPSLKRNDVVLATELVNGSGDRWEIGVGVPPGAGARPGRLLTADRILRTSAEKAEARDRSGADVVDMETAGVADECARRGVRFLSIRVVSDEAGVDLPPEILTILGPTGVFRLGATLGALWRRPACVKELLALRGHAIEAADRLADVVAGVLPQLP